MLLCRIVVDDAGLDLCCLTLLCMDLIKEEAEEVRKQIMREGKRRDGVRLR